MGISTTHHDPILDCVWVRYLAEYEFIIVGSGLYLYIAKVEESRDEPRYMTLDVLDTWKGELGDAADEESFLLDINDSLGGNDPHVEVVVYPHHESVDPKEEDDGVFEEVGKDLEYTATKAWHEVWESLKYDQYSTSEGEYTDEVHEDIEPVAVNNLEYFLGWALTLEVVATEILHRVRSLETK